MSLFGNAGGGGLFGRASESDLAGNHGAGRPTPPGANRAQSYAAKLPVDEAQRLAQQIGDVNAAAAAGFRAAGGATPAGDGAPRRGPGVR
jgi:hypothetical protein